MRRRFEQHELPIRSVCGAARRDLEPSPPTPPPPTTSATLSVSRAVPLASGALALGRAARKQYHIYTDENERNTE